MAKKHGTIGKRSGDSAGAKEKRSVCPVACTLDVLGDKWTLLVVRDMFAGKRRFKEFLGSPERIASNILAERLERLVRAGVASAEASGDHAGAMEYTLTEAGRGLMPVLASMRDWGLANVKGTKALIKVS
jgi:DNA-binding HxlR family transcriptional regulator